MSCSGKQVGEVEVHATLDMGVVFGEGIDAGCILEARSIAAQCLEEVPRTESDRAGGNSSASASFADAKLILLSESSVQNTFVLSAKRSNFMVATISLAAYTDVTRIHTRLLCRGGLSRVSPRGQTQMTKKLSGSLQELCVPFDFPSNTNSFSVRSFHSDLCTETVVFSMPEIANT